MDDITFSNWCHDVGKWRKLNIRLIVMSSRYDRRGCIDVEYMLLNSCLVFAGLIIRFDYLWICDNTQYHMNNEQFVLEASATNNQN